jgi:hypothetical protein
MRRRCAANVSPPTSNTTSPTVSLERVVVAVGGGASVRNPLRRIVNVK